MKKNVLTILLALTLMIGFLCGFPLQAISKEKVVKWNLNVWGGPRAYTAPIEKWAKDMAKYTNGKWQIKIQYGGVLSPPKETLDGIKAGMYEATMFAAAYHPAKVPLHRIMELPFISPGENSEILLMQYAMHEHPAFKKELLRWGAVPLIPAAIPTYHLMGNKAIRSVEDFKGVRVRIGGDIAKVLRKFGAVPTMVPAPQTYEALSRGTVDLVGLAYTFAYGSFKIHEVSKYMNIPMTLGVVCGPVVASKTAYDALPKEFKKIHRVWYDQSPYVYAAEYAKVDRKWESIFKKKLQYIQFPASERAKLVARAQPVYDAWVAEMEKKRLPGKEVMEYYLKKRKEISGY